MLIHQSDLKSMNRCGEQHRRQLAGDRGHQLSATAFGSVMHHALHTLERHRDLALAINTFEHYWHPLNIDEICEPVEVWIPRQSYSTLLAKGKETLKRYWDLKRFDDEEVLALEFPFVVPILGTTDPLTGKNHELAGTVDRLSLRYYKRQLHVCLDDWKGLARDTPLPTPTGWTTMGAVQVGDALLGSDGLPTRVTAKSQIHERPCYRVTFDDSSSVVADNVHLWTVSIGDLRALSNVTLSTQALAKRVADGEPIRIWNAEPLDLPDADLPIDPYVLGAWLGDGCRTRGVITKPDAELFDNISVRGYDLGVPQVDSRTGCLSRTVLGLQKQLADVGYLGHKVVPEIYLRGSFSQRLDLLRGLMDTDGTWNIGRRRAVFTSTDKVLAENVRELVVTLGWKATVFPLKKTGFGKTIEAYDVCFTPVEHNPFALARKADLVDTLHYRHTQRPWRRLVRSIEPVPSVPTQCIQVDAKDSLFLCGEQMVPTHNTGKKPTFLQHHIQFSAYAYATTQPEFWLGNATHLTDGFGEIRGADLYSRLLPAPRHGWWINVMGGPDWIDAGLRGERDYRRFARAVDNYALMRQQHIYPLNIEGEVCQYCPFRDDCPEGIDQ